MNIKEFSEKARSTAFYAGRGTFFGLSSYAALNLAAEAGEVAGAIAKMQRDDGIMPYHDGQYYSDAHIDNIIKENGDILWMIVAVCDEISTPEREVTIEDCMIACINKLAKRSQDGTLKGSGDNR